MRSIRLLCTSLLLGLWTCSALAADWKVGIARVDITPEKPVWMAGYAARDHLPEGTIHPLWAKALAIEDSAGSRLVVVTTDLIGMPRELGDAVCARAKKSTGIDRGRVLLNFSHTHCGPVVLACAPVAYGLTSEQYADAEAYARTLQDKLVKLIEAASADLRPARLAYGEDKATFAINRRAGRTLKKGEPVDRSALVPVDHSVPVLRVTDAQG
jgi:neutral ceramidase